MASVTIKIENDSDLISCRRQAERLALEMGFTEIDRVRIVTAVSEIVRNVLTYGKSGQMVVRTDGTWIMITIEDYGPGIKDLQQAITDGYSTSDGLGIGLGGSKRLMDVFQIDSTPGCGTYVQMGKCLA